MIRQCRSPAFSAVGFPDPSDYYIDRIAPMANWLGHSLADSNHFDYSLLQAISHVLLAIRDSYPRTKSPPKSMLKGTSLLHQHSTNGARDGSPPQTHNFRSDSLSLCFVLDTSSGLIYFQTNSCTFCRSHWKQYRCEQEASNSVS